MRIWCWERIRNRILLYYNAHSGSGIRYLSGNQMGTLLVDFLSRMEDITGRTLITTIVTGDLGPVIASAHGCQVIRTLTGSKFVCDKINGLDEDEFLLGYEESNGYMAGWHVRDKDAVSAALLFCEAAAYHKSHGKTLIDVLDELYREFGCYRDGQDSFVFEGREGERKMALIMDRLRRDGQSLLAPIGHIQVVTDYLHGIDGLPPSDVLKFFMRGGSWITVRPSGTEPKIKFYYCIRAGNGREAEELYEHIQTQIRKLIREKL